MAIKEVLHTDLAPAAVGPYSQAIASNGFIYTSGQIPIDPATGKIEAATIEEQTEQVMKNLQYVLAHPSTALSRPPVSCLTSTILQHSTAFTLSISPNRLRLAPAYRLQLCRSAPRSRLRS